MSVSWPTAEMVGTRTAASARQTASALNAARSSRPPPPRPTMQTSTPGQPVDQPERAHQRLDRAVALHPRVDHQQRAPGQRRRATVMMSRSAAPAVLVTTASVQANVGQRPLAGGIEEAVLLQQRLDPLELLLRLADGRGGEHARRR